MRHYTGKSTLLRVTLALAAGIFLFAGQASAQQKTVEQNQTGPTEYKVDTRNTTVAYVERNHLVVRLADGSLEAMRIPAGETFNIDGEKLTLQELKPGMTLTEETFTTTRPITVKTVEISDGTIWHVSANRLIIRTKENKLVEYNVPEWATVNINGQEESLVALRRGQQINTTIITEEPMTVSEREVRSHGHNAPAPTKRSAMETLPLTKPVTPPEASKAVPATELQPAAETEEKLPETASQLPLLGLLGLLAIAMSLGVRAYRKSN